MIDIVIETISPALLLEKNTEALLPRETAPAKKGEQCRRALFRNQI